MVSPGIVEDTSALAMAMGTLVSVLNLPEKIPQEVFTAELVTPISRLNAL